MTAPELTPEEKAEVARFGVHDLEVNARGASIDLAVFDETARWDDPPATMTVQAFMADRRLQRHEFAELLREYRSETGWSAFEMGDRGVLDSDFLNWVEWERLG